MAGFLFLSHCSGVPTGYYSTTSTRGLSRSGICLPSLVFPTRQFPARLSRCPCLESLASFELELADAGFTRTPESRGHAATQMARLPRSPLFAPPADLHRAV